MAEVQKFGSIPVEREFNIEMPLTADDDPISAVVKNAEYQQLLSNDYYLKEAIFPVFTGTSTLPDIGWTPQEAFYYFDIVIPGVEDTMIPELGPASAPDAVLASKINVLLVESVVGAIRVWVQKLPTQDIAVWYRVRRQ